MSRPKAPKAKVTREDKHCLNCGRRISPGRSGRRKFCSNACKQAWYRKNKERVTSTNSERNNTE